jgi:hypothetical protein
MVTSSISRPDPSAQSFGGAFGGAHKGRVRMHAFIGVSICAYI